MILKIGHRGAMGYAPENTLSSFKKALELNVDMIELDIHACKSGELVVIHNNKVDGTTNGQGYVAEKTFKELRGLDAGKGEKIPTLNEVLNFIDKRVKVNIELKGANTTKPVCELVEDYIKKKGWKYDDFLISSFDHYKLEEVNRLNPNIKIGALIVGIPIGFAEFAERVNAYSVNLCMGSINQEFVNDAHDRGLKVYVWTVNDLDDIERMRSLGVDGIFSNFPDRITG